MNIGIDGNEANVLAKVGIGAYAFSLVSEFAKLSSSDYRFRLYLKENPRIEMPPPSEHFRYTIFGPQKLWTQFALPMHLFVSRPRPNVFFTPTHYAPRFSPIPTVISVMDLSYIHFPHLFNKKDLFQLKQWTSYSVKNAAKILTISKSSKDDIINYYHVSKDKVVVTYPGISENKPGKEKTYSMEKLQKKYGITTDYILFVGTLQPRKNITRLIEAFAKIVKNHPEISLIVVGKKGWQYEEILLSPGKFGVGTQVKFLDFVTDDDLPLFYQNAICFVLPSLYEGFGLPVLEAMKFGCPVITSNVSSLPEAGGTACLYIDPLDIDDIAQKLKQMIEDPLLRKKMVQAGRRHIKKFSWEKTAKETLAVLQEVANKQYEG